MRQLERQYQYNIGQLAQASGVARRTIRYYVQRGLLPPPRGAGRGHYYTEEHLERLLAIRELRGRGLALEVIRSVLDAGRGADAAPGVAGREFARLRAPGLERVKRMERAPEEPPPEPPPVFRRRLGGDPAELVERAASLEIELLTRIRVGEGVDLVISQGAKPPSPSQVRAIAVAVSRILEGR